MHSPVVELKPDRVHYLDWLKVLAVYGIGVYHSSLVFGYTSWLVNNHERSIFLTAFTGFTFPWGIPLLFFVAGADASFALRKRGATAFARKRFLRLVLPLAVGMAVLSPFQAWIISGVPRSPLSLWLYYPRFFKGLRLDWTPQWLGWYSYHLWFLGYLFVISIVTLPLLEWLLREHGRRAVSALAAICDRWAGLYVPVIPLALAQLWLRPHFPSYQDWADVATYTYVFVSGFVFIADRRFESAVGRNLSLAIKVGVTASVGLAALLGVGAQHLQVSPAVERLQQMTFALLWSLDLWSWLIAVIYLGVRWLNRNSRVMEYCSESIMPYYVINHPVIVVIAVGIVQLPLPVWPKFVSLALASVIVTLLIYEFGVRRWSVTRFLFGLSPSGSTEGPAASSRVRPPLRPLSPTGP